ncbi:MAG: CAP domain-containing protein [Reinekea sp.]|nr:CAP domain-containing protein [Reinekea sp.]
MKYAAFPLLLCTILLASCLPEPEPENTDNVDDTGGEEITDHGPFTLSGSITGYTSDVAIKLVVNGDTEEVQELIYLAGSFPDVNFATPLSTGDTLGLVIQTAPLHEQCEVTALTSTVQSEAPTFTIQCSDVCGTDAICSAWRNTHNALRSSLSEGAVTDDGTDGNYPIPSSPLPDLVWNEKLAQVAQAHAEACVYEHNADRQTEYVAAGGENIYIGENIAYKASSAALQPLENYAEILTNAWWDEHTDWHYQAYESATINGAGHFTQIIWENTIEIGCGVASCPNMVSGFNTAFGVCNYAPGGNYINQYPYQIN